MSQSPPTTGDSTTLEANSIASSTTVSISQLRELWIHTGTACNLECPFCFEGSRPGDARIERLTLTEIKPFLDEAAALGVERFCFTGGEPLIVKDIVKILCHALQLRPALLITNGTAPLLKRAHQLTVLKEQPHSLRFRVSIDHANEQRHDQGRGWGNFKRALEGTRLLLDAGFEVEIARQSSADEDPENESQEFNRLFREYELPKLRLHALPDLDRPGVVRHFAPVERVGSQAAPMCGFSRMVIRREGRLKVNACAFTDDDPAFEMGSTLKASLGNVELRHHRCRLCILKGASLS